MFKGTSITTSRLEAPNSTSVTPEVEFKLEVVCPNRYIWDFSSADTCVKWAVSQGLRIRGNCLVWHRGVPKWVKELPIRERETHLKQYIQLVVGGYPEVEVWDVVNEAIADNGCFRDTSPWCGIDNYVEKAFGWAHEANPNAKLFFNDYRPMAKEKWVAIFKCIDQMRSHGVPVHGVGIQLHHHLRRYLAEGVLGWQSLRWVVEEAKSRNLLVEFTEVSVLDDLGMPWLRAKVMEELYAIAQQLDVIGFTVWHWSHSS